MASHGEILRDAHAAADAAHQDIPDVGAVGIARVNIFPGTSSFARWLRRNDHAQEGFNILGHRQGVDVYVRSGKQSYAANDAAAKAFAQVLKDNDIDAYAVTRFD